MEETGELSMAELDQIDSEVLALIDDAVDQAKSAARPTPGEVDQDVYINYGASA
jgi:pyruvate dehydrogenase E1 component alpha subunit